MDWKTQLNNYIKDQSNKEFKYGRQDCFLFAIRWIEVLWKKELLDELSPKGYKSLKDGKEQIFKHLQDKKPKDFLLEFWIFCMNKWNQEEVGRLFLQSGDLVLLKVDKRTTSCIVQNGKALSTGKKGISWIDISEKNFIKAWRVDKCHQ